MKQLVLVIIWMINIGQVQAQARKEVRSGNEQYRKGNFEQAAVDYQKGIQKDTGSYAGLFNLGNALYQQKKYEQARKVMNAAAAKSTDKSGAANAQYNAGNSFMEEKNWAEAIEQYKKTLRKNPQDADAKYNLAYAQKMLKKDGGKDNKNKDKEKKDDKKDQDKKEQDKQEQDKKEQPKDQQDQQNKEQNKEQQKPKPQPSKLSKEQADQLLNALQQEEKKVQDKLKKGEAPPVRNAKDW